MRAWRICREKHLPTALSGIGAELAGGRWNSKGERMTYASSSLSLAALEFFVHLDPSMMPDDLWSLSVTLPNLLDFPILSIDHLPKNWRVYPAPEELKAIGSNWLQEAESLALIVPSAVNPEENNLLINPAHPDFSLIGKVQSKPFQFDPRMWK